MSCLTPLRSCAAVSNSSGFERCVTSPVWSTIAGGFGSLPIRSIAACNVALVSGFASLLKPIWLSLICTKVKPSAADAAKADLSAMGLGDRGCAASAVVSQAFRLGDRAERPYPPGRAEGRRQRHLSDRVLDRLPAAEGWRRSRAGADEGAGRSAPKRPRHPR